MFPLWQRPFLHTHSPLFVMFINLMDSQFVQDHHTNVNMYHCAFLFCSVVFTSTWSLLFFYFLENTKTVNIILFFLCALVIEKIQHVKKNVLFLWHWWFCQLCTLCYQVVRTYRHVRSTRLSMYLVSSSQHEHGEWNLTTICEKQTDKPSTDYKKDWL